MYYAQLKTVQTKYLYDVFHVFRTAKHGIFHFHFELHMPTDGNLLQFQNARPAKFRHQILGLLVQICFPTAGIKLQARTSPPSRVHVFQIFA